LTCFGYIEILHDNQVMLACAVIVLTTRNDLTLSLTGGCRCALRSNRPESVTGAAKQVGLLALIMKLLRNAELLRLPKRRTHLAIQNAGFPLNETFAKQG
jgi:hypothetical protein